MYSWSRAFFIMVLLGFNRGAQSEDHPLALLKKYGINAGGWLALGATYDLENPTPHNNAPISFNDQTATAQLNQVNLFLETAVDREAKQWNLGYRLDTLFGTDSRFSQATGLDNQLLHGQNLGQYDLAFPQAYIEIASPYSKNVTAKIGHFYSLIGHEVVSASHNFFYSHSYTMQYGEPFTHTGALLNVALNENFALNASAVTGWDKFISNQDQWSFLGNISWTDNLANNAVTWSVISGDANIATPTNRTLTSVIISHNFSDKLRYVFQHDFAVQQRTEILSHPVYWYGLNQYLFYDLNEYIALGIRGEWFRDNNGTRLNNGYAGNYMAITTGVNWKARSWLTFRPEIRYDWSDSNLKVYDNHYKNQQLEIAIDMLVSF